MLLQFHCSLLRMGGSEVLPVLSLPIYWLQKAINQSKHSLALTIQEVLDLDMVSNLNTALGCASCYISFSTTPLSHISCKTLTAVL